jgi:hypothetical protein
MVNVDTVYKTVLTILNKEQRGYLTPAEFNRIGTQVQLEIFEKYFEDINQQFRVPQPSNEFTNRLLNAEEKLAIFKTTGVLSGVWNAPDPDPTYYTLPEELHTLGTIMMDESLELQRVQRNELLLLNRSKLTKPNKKQPVYVLEGEYNATPPAAQQHLKKAYIYPRNLWYNGQNTKSTITTSYIRTPNSPRWGYTTGNVGQYVYDSSVYTSTGLALGTNNLFSTITNSTIPTATPQTTPLIIVNPTTSGVGSGFTITVNVDASGIIISVGVSTSGSGFTATDTITLTNAEIPGLTTNLNLQLNAASLQSNNTSGSTDFEIHESEQIPLILNILMYTGVIIRDPTIVQNAAQMSLADEQNEKI